MRKKIKLILKEAKVGGSYLYHYTTIKNFKEILDSNVLKSHLRIGHTTADKPFVSLTRDLRRSFSPTHSNLTIGLRLDADLLKTKYGKKIRPTVDVKPEKISNVTYKVSDRYESEERIYGDINNIKNYINGIVFSVQSFNISILPKYIQLLINDQKNTRMERYSYILAYLLAENRLGSVLFSQIESLDVPLIFLFNRNSVEFKEINHIKQLYNYFIQELSMM